LDPDALAAVCRAAGMEAAASPTLADAIQAARGGADDADCILVTGSLFTVADARRLLAKG